MKLLSDFATSLNSFIFSKNKILLLHYTNFIRIRLSLKAMRNLILSFKEFIQEISNIER